ncbi:hypothetical protein VE03_00894 [Pseudogymnoascus sp. 23342-1-I1]|nr:hypothetical protein VE03_00894 [Pseudogymnoascus sp. 23342-1-I1]
MPPAATACNYGKGEEGGEGTGGWITPRARTSVARSALAKPDGVAALLLCVVQSIGSKGGREEEREGDTQPHWFPAVDDDGGDDDGVRIHAIAPS